MIVIYIVCFLLVLYYLYTKNYSYWQSRGVPFEKPFFIFGNFYNIATRKQHIFDRIREIYDNFSTPYVGIFIFNQPTLVVRSPQLLKKILVKDFDKFMNRQFASNESVDPIAAHALFSAKDQIWRNLRAKISPVFTSGKMKLMLPLMKECASDLNTYLDKRTGQVLEVGNVMKMYAVDVISSCAFGVNAHCLKNDGSKIMEIATKLMDVSSWRRSFAIFSYFFAPKLVDIFRMTLFDKSSTDFLCRMFNDTIEERKIRKILRNDLIDLLNCLLESENWTSNYKFDSIKLASQAITFFTAGNDATSSIISYTLYELALNQTIQDRLRKEVQETFEHHGDFTYEAIQEMKYLDMVLNETLRKYPLTTFLNRESVTQYTFEDTGFTLDKGVSIMIPIAGLHFDPEYFPDPERYNPDRFSEENKHKIVPFTFMPFGEGPRNCLGQRFAVLVAKVAVAYTIRDCVFEQSVETTVPLEFNTSSMFMINKDGLKLKVTRV